MHLNNHTCFIEISGWRLFNAVIFLQKKCIEEHIKMLLKQNNNLKIK